MGKKPFFRLKRGKKLVGEIFPDHFIASGTLVTASLHRFFTGAGSRRLAEIQENGGSGNSQASQEDPYDMFLSHFCVLAGLWSLDGITHLNVTAR